MVTKRRPAPWHRASMPPQPRTATVKMFRAAPPGTREPAAPLGSIEVPLLGNQETSDAALKLAKRAAAAHTSTVESDVLVNHVVGGGFVAYVPALPLPR